jgi:serine/threonine protein kinase
VTDGMYRGTDEYMAPEVSAGKTSFYGLPADIWSIGVTFYELVFGRLCKVRRDSESVRLLAAHSPSPQSHSS